MASFLEVILVIMTFMSIPSLSLLQTTSSNDHILKLKSTPISAAPAVLPSPSTHSSPSPVSPFTEITPDISPLFPKTGGKVPPTPSSIPTIPSNPSPPNPDDIFSLTPEALSPLASLPASSSASPLNHVKSLMSSAVFMGILVLVLAM